MEIDVQNACVLLTFCSLIHSWLNRWNHVSVDVVLRQFFLIFRDGTRFNFRWLMIHAVSRYERRNHGFMIYPIIMWWTLTICLDLVRENQSLVCKQWHGLVDHTIGTGVYPTAPMWIGMVPNQDPRITYTHCIHVSVAIHTPLHDLWLIPANHRSRLWTDYWVIFLLTSL